MTIEEMKEKRIVALEAAKAITDLAKNEDRDLTEAEADQVDEHLDLAENLAAKIEAADVEAKRQTRLDAGLASLDAPAQRWSSPDPIGGSMIDEPAPLVAVPASVPRFGRVQHFSGATQAEAELKAYKFGMWVCAANGNARAQQFCRDAGMPLVGATITDKGELAINTEGSNSGGGYLVQDEFENDIVRLVETYGVCRRNMRQSPMTSDTKSRPRRTGGLTAYHVGENAAGTESNITTDRINLVAKKIMALTTMSSELSEDAAISIGDLLLKEIALAFAYTEDNDGFNGDGTSTYGSIVGLISKLTAATAGLITGASGTDASWAGITLANHNSLLGLLAEYVTAPKWYCSNTYWGSVMQKLAMAAGGNSVVDIVSGKPQKMFMGYPVETVAVMPKSASTAEIVCAFGDLSMAADFGLRRGVTIKFSEDATIGGTNMFESDDVAVKGTERFDVNVHDVGDTSNAGPIVGLLTAS